MQEFEGIDGNPRLEDIKPGTILTVHSGHDGQFAISISHAWTEYAYSEDGDRETETLMEVYFLNSKKRRTISQDDFHFRVATNPQVYSLQRRYRFEFRYQVGDIIETNAIPKPDLPYEHYAKITEVIDGPIPLYLTNHVGDWQVSIFTPFETRHIKRKIEGPELTHLLLSL